MNTRKIASFLLICFGLASLIGGLLFVTIGVESLLAKLGIAFTYMMTPLVAAVIVDRGFQKSFVVFSNGNKRGSLRIIVTPLIAFLLFVILFFGMIYLLGNIWHIDGVGSLVTSIEVMKNHLIALFHPTAEQIAHMRLPSSVLPLYIVSIIAAIVAGFSINGLFTFGEEYGWRGFLWRELRHLGWVRGNLLLGAIWGLWHAPLILQGYNYGHSYALIGVVVMVIAAICLSFILTAVREQGNVLSAAAFHGMINGIAFSLPIMPTDANPLIGGIVGLCGAGCAFVVGILFWTCVKSKKTHTSPPHPGTTPTL